MPEGIRRAVALLGERNEYAVSLERQRDFIAVLAHTTRYAREERAPEQRGIVLI